MLLYQLALLKVYSVHALKGVYEVHVGHRGLDGSQDLVQKPFFLTCYGQRSRTMRHCVGYLLDNEVRFELV